MEKGFSYFSIEPIQSTMNKTAFVPNEGGHLYAAVLDGDDHGRAIEVSHGGGGVRYITVPGAAIVTWHSKAIVAMYNDAIPQRTVVWRAQSVLDMLGEYVKTNGSSTPPARVAISMQSAFAVGPEKQLVNIHQYLQAHLPRPSINAYPDSYAQNVAPSSLPPVDIAPASRAADGPTSYAAPAPAPAPAHSAPTPMAQAVATQMGCGAVQADGDLRFIAPCGTYDVLIDCDGGQCRPLHTIKDTSKE